MSNNRATNWEVDQTFDPTEIYNELKSSYANVYSNLDESEIDDYLDRIAFHESKGEAGAVQQVNDKYDKDGNVISYKDGPGRGLFQFEIGEDQGAQIAKQRFYNYYKSQGNDAMMKLAKSLPDDFSKISPDMQKALFMTNMMAIPNRGEGHVAANLSEVKKHGDQGLEDFWINYHWAGWKTDPDSIVDRRKSWKRDNKIYNQRALD